MAIHEAPTLLAAFSLGLLGSAHCIGMCGGITSALSMSLQGHSARKNSLLMLTYHFGRILSYGLAGLLLALLGWYLGQLAPEVKRTFRYGAAFMLIAMGLYLTGWWRGLTTLEKGGQHLWRHIQPIASKLLPIKGYSNALLVGALWGWLPCGLVYSVLTWSATQGSALQGFLLMVAFGLGTLPSVFLLGAFSRQLSHIVQAQLTRNIAGLMIIVFGLWSLPGGHHRWIMSWVQPIIDWF